LRRSQQGVPNADHVGISSKRPKRLRGAFMDANRVLGSRSDGAGERGRPLPRGRSVSRVLDAAIFGAAWLFVTALALGARVHGTWLDLVSNFPRDNGASDRANP
jgi:hypothetical protein